MQGDAGNRSAAKAVEHRAGCPSAVIDGAGVAPGSAPTRWPANLSICCVFLFTFKAGTLQPLPSEVSHSNMCSLWSFQHGHPHVLSNLVWSLYQIAKDFGLVLVFLGRLKDLALANTSQVSVHVGNPLTQGPGTDWAGNVFKPGRKQTGRDF